VTESDDIGRLLGDFFNRHPEVKAPMDRERALKQQRQQAYDAMDLPELREAAITSLTSAAETIMNTSLDTTLLSNGWTPENKAFLASYFLELVENIDVESLGGTNMAKWFDFSLSGGARQDDLQTVAYESTRGLRRLFSTKVGLTKGAPYRKI
jgi:hypothetical protein